MSAHSAKATRPAWLALLSSTAILAACAIQPAHAERLIVYNNASGDTYISTDQADGIGDKILWRSEMQTEAGEALGTGSGHCTKLDSEENYFCSFVISLKDRGIISGHGVQRTEPLNSTYPITGGTGEFAGVSGKITSRPIENRARFIYEIEYKTAGTPQPRKL